MYYELNNNNISECRYSQLTDKAVVVSKMENGNYAFSRFGIIANAFLVLVGESELNEDEATKEIETFKYLFSDSEKLVIETPDKKGKYEKVFARFPLLRSVEIDYDSKRAEMKTLLKALIDSGQFKIDISKVGIDSKTRTQIRDFGKHALEGLSESSFLVNAMMAAAFYYEAKTSIQRKPKN